MEHHHGSVHHAVSHMKDTNGATRTAKEHPDPNTPPPPPLATTVPATMAHTTNRSPNTNDPNTFMMAQASASTAPVTGSHATTVPPPRRVSVVQGDTNGNYNDASNPTPAPALPNPNAIDTHNPNDAIQKHTIEEQERIRKRDANRTKDLVERAFLLGVVKAHSKRLLLRKHAQKEMSLRQAQAQAQVNSYGPNIWNAQGSTMPIMNSFGGGSEDEGVQMTTSEYYHHLHLQNDDRASSSSSLERRTKNDGFRHGPLDLQWEF